MSQISDLVDNFNSILDDLDNKEVSSETLDEIDSLVEKISLNLSVITNLTVEPTQILKNVKKLLLTDKIDIDYAELLELLNHLLPLIKFEDIIQNYSIDDLQNALKSKIIPLQQSACKIIANSYPKGLFTTTILFDILLDIYFNVDTDILIINDIEKIWYNLCSDELVQRTLLVNNFPLLQMIKNMGNPISLARLLKLLEVLFDLSMSLQQNFPKDLFLFQMDELLKFVKVDILLFIHIIKYLANLIDILQTNLSRQWILPILKDMILNTAELFTKREEIIDIKYFAIRYMFILFQKISFLDNEQDVFRIIDSQYLDININNEYLIDYLSFINPKYLLIHYKQILKEFVVLSPSKLSIIRNLVSSKDTFVLIKEHLNSNDILKLPYMEQMVLLQKMSQYKHSMSYLLQHLPKIMSNLIENPNGPILELETIELRRETLRNLLAFAPEELNVWYPSILKEYRIVEHGSSKTDIIPQTRIASTFL